MREGYCDKCYTPLHYGSCYSCFIIRREKTEMEKALEEAKEIRLKLVGYASDFVHKENTVYQKAGVRRSKITARARVFNRDGNKCLKCGSTKRLTIDHILPLSLGGSNKQFNLQTLCRSCNQEKGIQTIDYRKK